MLSQDVREALGAELEHLRIRRKAITERLDQDIAALETVLRQDGGFPEQGVLSIPAATGTGSAPINGPLAGKGCRDAIRMVLTSFPNSKAAEISTKMGEMGWSPSGSTSLKVRVGSELHRMRKQKLVVKRGSRFSLPPATEPESGVA